MSGYRGRGRGNRRIGGAWNRGRGRGFAANRDASNICQHYLNGSCSFGTRCRNYHPPVLDTILDTADPTETAQPTPRVGAGRGSGRGRMAGLVTIRGAVRGSFGRGRPFPRPSGNTSASNVAVNRIPDDALNTRAVPPDELSDDDDFLEDGEIDDESDLSVDYNDLHGDNAQDVEEYFFMHDEVDFSDDSAASWFGEAYDGDEIWGNPFENYMRRGFGNQANRQPAAPNNAPAAANGALTADDVQSFATRVTQSMQSKDEQIKELKEEVDRLKEIIEGTDESKKDGRLCTLKCGVCLDIKKATEFAVNTPCGHCFCKTCNASLKGNRDSKCPKCRAKVQRQTDIFV